MFRQLESVIFFVCDIDAAAAWYADILGAEVRHENPLFAYLQGPGLVLGFHPADDKNPVAPGGTVDDAGNRLGHAGLAVHVRGYSFRSNRPVSPVRMARVR